MHRLIIIADDFTGALDTGVQFAKVGIKTLVSANMKFAQQMETGSAEVLVLNIETRHKLPAQARDTVRQVVTAANRMGIPYIYKKTDSGMRGNIGSELEGLFAVDGMGPAVFVPAYPAVGRTTAGGVHYSEGKPISQTSFGRDPFTPVLDDYIPDIIARQTRRQVVLIAESDLDAVERWRGEEAILLFDAQDEAQMSRIAQAIAALGPPNLMAGCAGFAEYLPELLSLTRCSPEEHVFQPGLLVACGSVHERTLEQVHYAAENGFSVIGLTPQQKLIPDLAASEDGAKLLRQIKAICLDNPRVILQASPNREDVRETDRMAAQMGLSPDQVRERTANNLGGLIGTLLRTKPTIGTLAVFGGDTLHAVMDAIGEQGLQPAGEILTGIVHSVFAYAGQTTNLITKSGGFGEKDSILQIEQYIRERSHAMETKIRA